MRDCARLQDTCLGFYVCISADGRDWGRCIWGIGRQIHTVPHIGKKRSAPAGEFLPGALFFLAVFTAPAPSGFPLRLGSGRFATTSLYLLLFPAGQDHRIFLPKPPRSPFTVCFSHWRLPTRNALVILRPHRPHTAHSQMPPSLPGLHKAPQAATMG